LFDFFGFVSFGDFRHDRKMGKKPKVWLCGRLSS